MISWTTLATPIGEMFVAATPDGVARVAFEVEDFDAVRAALGPEDAVQHDPAALATPARELQEYFAGARREFSFGLDWRGASGFRVEAQHALGRVGYGQRVTYTQLADLAGRPTAVRAVASACATNPLPIVVGCHRVLRSDGSLGGFRGGLAAKQWLLDWERAHS